MASFAWRRARGLCDLMTVCRVKLDHNNTGLDSLRRTLICRPQSWTLHRIPLRERPGRRYPTKGSRNTPRHATSRMRKGQRRMKIVRQSSLVAALDEFVLLTASMATHTKRTRDMRTVMQIWYSINSKSPVFPVFLRLTGEAEFTLTKRTAMYFVSAMQCPVAEGWLPLLTSGGHVPSSS
ncbi:hypothetical protein BDZ85DRAFT_107826 [Elsinoe ampelina]|uniref:Uncharacterized protein n=1 Tax=Elsinoe ampelina TaxID=302913 RepID=A0A6A6GC90_9PEZI|nr:hypothetical protein BDZ85DRAFT_107826 [Elsinoe ampelina]